MCCGLVLFCGIVVCLDHRHLFGIFTRFGPKTKKKPLFVRSCQSNIELTSSYVWNVVGPIFLNIVHLHYFFFNELAFVTINESYLF